MRVRVLLLRFRGALLPLERAEEDWLEGWLRLSTRDRGMGEPVSVLELNPVLAAPGIGIFARLYAPVLEGFERGDMRLRGLEVVRLQPDGPLVGIVQNWRIDLLAANEGRIKPIAVLSSHGGV